MRRRRNPFLTLSLVGAVMSVATGFDATLSAFSATTSNTGNTFSSQRIFPADRGTTGWDLRDAADGSESNESYTVAFTDGRYYGTKNWTLGSFSTDRYVETEFNSPLPAGLPFGSATFDLSYADDGGSGSACYYFEVRRASDGTVLATHGSPSSPIDCQAGSTIVTISTSTPSLDTTDEANDLLIRIYMSQAAGDNIRVDATTVSGTIYGKSVTLYPTIGSDRADGTTLTGAWGPTTSGDGSNYQTVGNWSSSFSSSRYLEVTFPAYLPNAAVVTSASISHAYRSATSGTTCWYLEVYDGGTLIGTHGSSGSPISCNSSSSTYVSDVVTVGEVNTASEANNVVIRIYARNSASARSQHDLIQLTVNYSLAATGCVDPGVTTVTSMRDSWVDQSAPTSTGGGDDADLRVRSRSPNENRRTFVWFPLPTPEGCSMTSATLRLFLNSVNGTRTLEVWRVSGSWTESGLNWNNQPGTTGTAVTASNSSGWQTWTVTSMVQAMYAGQNDGFMVKDATEESATGFEQRIDARENADDPQLLITFA